MQTKYRKKNDPVIPNHACPYYNEYEISCRLRFFNQNVTTYIMGSSKWQRKNWGTDGCDRHVEYLVVTLFSCKNNLNVAAPWEQTLFIHSLSCAHPLNKISNLNRLMMNLEIFTACFFMSFHTNNFTGALYVFNRKHDMFSRETA